jgi:uncharacterized membrane protein
MTIALFLHLVADVVWIGGMFLAYMAVRPAVVEVLEPPLRLRLWAAIFRRFFPWVWAAIVLLLGSGFSMMGTMGKVPLYVIGMTLIGIVMTAIFLYIYFLPFGALRRAVAAQEWQAGGAALGTIRMLVGTNLVLGLVNIAVAVFGRTISLP